MKPVPPDHGTSPTPPFPPCDIGNRLHDLEGTYIRRRVSYHKSALLNIVGVPLKLSEAHTLLDAFAKLRKTTITFVISVCLSLPPHGTPRLPMNGFS